jgi:hypothetical protein
MLKLIGMTVCAAAVCLTSLGAAAGQTETKSTIKIKDGKEVHVTGCVAPTASGAGFVLTNVADKSGAMHSYMLVSDDSDLSKHVGHRVQLTGKVTDRGNAKIEMETKTKTKVDHGDDRETHSKSTVEGDVAGMAYLGVKSFKMIAASCP